MKGRWECLSVLSTKFLFNQPNDAAGRESVPADMAIDRCGGFAAASDFEKIGRRASASCGR
jgi:hypothetical protein